MDQASVKSIVRDYESRFAEEVSANYAWAFELGRHAMTVAFEAMSLGHGDRIGICSFSCLSVYEAVSVVGAQPFFLDIDQHLCIAPEALEKAAAELDAVVLQHTFGNPGQLEKLLQICEAHNILVIEDCAHAIGCFWGQKPLGSFGTCAVYSFEWGKPYSTGQGGMLTSNNNVIAMKIYDVVERVSNPPTLRHDLALAFHRFVREASTSSTIYPMIRGAVYKFRGLVQHKNSERLPSLPSIDSYVRRCAPMVARVGIKKLITFQQLRWIRSSNAELIEAELRKVNLRLWPRDSKANITILRYPVLVGKKHIVLNNAYSSGVELGGWYNSPIHPIASKRILEQIGYKPELCPKAEQAFGELVHLPTGPTLKVSNLRKAITIITQQELCDK